MPETAVRTDETAAPVAPETAARTEPSRESSRPVYTEFERLVMRERGELREALRKAEAEKNQMFGRALVAECHLDDAKAVITDLRLRQVKALLDHRRIQSRSECRAVVDLCVVAREQAAGWAQDEPGTLSDLTEIVRCYSEADSCDDARERLAAYLAERYQDTEPDEDSGRVMLTQFTGGVMSMLEDTSQALHSWLQSPDRGRDERSDPVFLLRRALMPGDSERNHERIGVVADPEPHEGPGWLESIQDAVCRVIPREIEALYVVADAAGDRIAEARRNAQDEYETACAAYADAKRVS